MPYTFTKLANVESISDTSDLTLNVIVENNGEINRISPELLPVKLTNMHEDVHLTDIDLYVDIDSNSEKGNLYVSNSAEFNKSVHIYDNLSVDSDFIVGAESTFNGKVNVENGIVVKNGIDIEDDCVLKNTLYIEEESNLFKAYLKSIKDDELNVLNVGYVDSNDSENNIIVRGIDIPLNDNDAVNLKYLNDNFSKISDFYKYIDITEEYIAAYEQSGQTISFQSYVANEKNDGFYYIKIVSNDSNDQDIQYSTYKFAKKLTYAKNLSEQSNLIMYVELKEYTNNTWAFSLYSKGIDDTNIDIVYYINSNGSMHYKDQVYLSCDDSTQVDIDIGEIETFYNKQTSENPISTYADDIKYPTSRAVKDYVDSQLVSSGSSTKKYILEKTLPKTGWSIDSLTNLYTQTIKIDNTDVLNLLRNSTNTDILCQICPLPHVMSTWVNKGIKCTTIDVSGNVTFTATPIKGAIENNISITITVWG